MSKYKVLFIHANNSVALFREKVLENNESLDESNDYLTDAIFLEIKNNDQFEVYECPFMSHMYVESDTKIENITGLGFSIRKKINKTPNCLSFHEALKRIEERYFNLIITDSRTMNKWWNDRKLSPFYEYSIKLRDHFLKFYHKNEIIFMDGEDQPEFIQSEFYGNSLYFKREIIYNDDNLIPIGYCFPTQYFRRSSIEDKVKSISTIVPGVKSTYIFNNENDYYEDYRTSFFGLTWKKLGWDCFRHHEIIFSSCLPIFPDIDNCPINTMTRYPKDICKKILNMDGVNKIDYNKLFIAHNLYYYQVSPIDIEDININQYEEILSEILEFSFKNNSSKSMLEYIIKYTNL